jgi:hypothetical protein
MYYHLNLDCDKSTTSGDLEPYSALGGPPWNPPNIPEGQVWWQSLDGATNWAPVSGSNPNQPGNPKHAHPVVQVNDYVSICIRDKNNPISSVTFAIVFGRRGNPNQAPIASPFQNTTGGTNNTYDQTVFTPQTVTQVGADGFFVTTLPQVSYPNGGSLQVNFGCYIGATVTYSDGTVREFGMDPEMDVSDYAASPRPAAAAGD